MSSGYSVYTNSPGVLGIGPKDAPHELCPAGANQPGKAEDFTAVDSEIDVVQFSGNGYPFELQGFLAAVGLSVYGVHQLVG